MMSSFDQLILKKFQLIQDWFQVNFGINNFIIAKLLWVISVLFFVLRIYFVFLRGIGFIDIYILPINAFLFFLLFKFSQRSEKFCKDYPEYKNTAKSNYFFYCLRIVTILMVITSLPTFIYFFIPSVYYHNIVILYWNVSDILLFSFVYFVSCTPKPYQTSKAKKLFRKGIEAIKTIGSKIRVPVPVPST